jgi:predicted nucleic acid-binding protein
MIDPSKFERLNVADTCSIWNVLSSSVLYSSAKAAGIFFSYTEFVRYECLHKPGQPRPERSELQSRLRRAAANGDFKCCKIDIEDLQDVEIIENRMRLSKGEISSIVFAKKSQQAFMTDDKKASKLARSVINNNKVQSTPHLLAWLYFAGRLQDSDKDTVIADLTALNRGSLKTHIDEAYREALRCRLLAQSLGRAPAPSDQKGMSSSVIGPDPGEGSGITKAPSAS